MRDERRRGAYEAAVYSLFTREDIPEYITVAPKEGFFRINA